MKINVIGKIGVGLLTMVIFALAASGCGPNDLKDQEYLDQMKAAGLDQNGENFKDTVYKMPPNYVVEEEEGEGSADNQAYEPAEEQAEVVVVKPTERVLRRPIRVVKLPAKYIKLRSKYTKFKPIVIRTGEDRNFEREVHHIQEIHQIQPEITKHAINKVVNLRHKYFTKIINHPVKTIRYYPTRSVVESHEKMPVQVVNLPPSRYMGYSYYPGYYRYRPYFGGCRGYFGRGWYGGCR